MKENAEGSRLKAEVSTPNEPSAEALKAAEAVLLAQRMGLLNDGKLPLAAMIDEAFAGVRRERDELKCECDDAQGALAGLADTLNQEIRENGSVDDQASLQDDLRPFVRRLVDYVRQRDAFAARREREALREGLRDVWERLRLKRCPECGLRFGVDAPGCKFCRADHAFLDKARALLAGGGGK